MNSKEDFKYFPNNTIGDLDFSAIPAQVKDEIQHMTGITITDSVTTDTIIVSDDYDYDITSITLNIPEEQTIEGVNKRLDAIDARLSILKPDAKMLEKYELLQSLYDQYKTAEALLKNNNTLK